MREINPFGLRMPAPLRDKLQRQARLNRRSLNSEIVERPSRSVERAATDHSTGHELAAMEDPSRFRIPTLSDIEESLLGLFRDLPPDKQLALVSLLK